MTPALPTKSPGPRCTCKVTGPDYHQTRFDRACFYHGDNGTMVVRIAYPRPGSAR